MDVKEQDSRMRLGENFWAYLQPEICTLTHETVSTAIRDCLYE